MAMHYLTRKDIMQRLRLSYSASYRIIGTARQNLVSSKDVLAILNQARRGDQPLLTHIPSDFLTEAELATEIGCISRTRVFNWTKRVRNVPPFFYLNSHCRRFLRSEVEKWLERNGQIIKRG